jgi:signal transduction histidine kinase
VEASVLRVEEIGASPSLGDGDIVVLPGLIRGWEAVVGSVLDRGALPIVAGASLPTDSIVEIGRLGGYAVWDGTSESFEGVVKRARERHDSGSGVHQSPARIRRLLRSIPASVWRLDASRSYDHLQRAYEPNAALRTLIEEATEHASLHPLNAEARRYSDDATGPIASALFETWLAGDRFPRIEVSLSAGAIPHTLLISAAMPGPRDMGHVIVVGIDVSERRELERALLASQRLEAVGRLAAGIAHDFNNLLTVLTTYTQFVFEDLPPESETRDDVVIMQDAIRRAASLVARLLDFGRDREPNLEPVDLAPVVRDIVALLTRTLGEHIRVRLDVEGDAMPVRADRTQLEQVLLNLAVNARDAMPEGGSLSLRLSRRRRDSSGVRGAAVRVPPGDYVCLTVADTGTGMTPDVAQRVFEPFFTTKADRGSGLGLATTYAIVKRHGGYVFLDTELGHGTTFEILLPVVITDEGVVSRPPTSQPAPRQRVLRVLVVEDDDAVRAALRRGLAARGYVVELAADAEEALAVLARGEPLDVLVSDITLPGLNGLKLIERALHVRPGIGAVLMSGYPEDASLATAFGERVPFVRKPADPSDLARAIERAMDEG